MNDVLYILAIIYAVNAVLCVLYAILVKARRSSLPASLFIVMLLVPVFGVAAYAIVGNMYARDRVGRKGVDTDRLDITNDAFRQIEITEDADVVPLQDALIMNEAATRRKMMMEILHKDPMQFTDLLKKVVLYDDTEMTHYSVTTIMEINSLYETELHERNREYAESPDDREVLFGYAAFIKRYIDSGLLEGTRLREMRIRYSHVLSDCIKAAPDEINFYLMCVENENEQRNYTRSRKLVLDMLEKWRGDERVWLCMLDAAVAQKDSATIKKLCAIAAANKSVWTQETKNRFAFFDGEGVL